jgi:hypothetical protein
MSKIRIILTILILILFGYSLFLRVKPRIPRDIFVEISYGYSISYLLLLIINIILLILLILPYVKKKQKDSIFQDNTYKLFFTINTLLFDGFYQILIYIYKIPYVGFPISWITRNFIKLNGKHYKYLIFFCRFIFLITLSLDVFYYQRFYYSYITMYLLLMPLVIKAILYLSFHYNEYISLEIKKSVTFKDPENTTQKLQLDMDLTLDDYELTEFNIEFRSVEHYFDVVLLIYKENECLYDIKDTMESSVYFSMFIRLWYIIIWGYIVYFYPLSILKLLILMIFTFIKPLIPPGISLLLGIILLYYLYKK